MTPDALKKKFFQFSTSFTQQEMQAYLENQSTAGGLCTAMEQLYLWSLNTGHLTQEKLHDNPKFTYKDPLTNIEFKTQVNIARSKYNPQPTTGSKVTPSHCPICFDQIDSLGKKNLRAFEFDLTRGRRFFIQFTPFPVHPYHAVIVSKAITPMFMSKQSIIDMIALVENVPLYTILSNSDVVGAGASIITHHHYQAIKNQTLPIMQAQTYACCQTKLMHQQASCQIALLDYPIASLRLTSNSKTLLTSIAGQVIRDWKSRAPGANTCNILLHQVNQDIQCTLLFRNPSHLTPTALLPIKSEYIGIIEVCGEGIYPVPTGKQAESLWGKIENEGLDIIKGIITGNNPIPRHQYDSFYQEVLHDLKNNLTSVHSV